MNDSAHGDPFRFALAQPKLLSRLNEQSVLRSIQKEGPATRAELTRRMRITAPTVSKAVATLLRSGLLEEYDAEEAGRGRPAKKLRLASECSCVLGLALDVQRCSASIAALDGEIRPDREVRFDTPGTYEGLLDAVEASARPWLADESLRLLGVGVSIPGLVDYRRMKGLFSPNLHITDGRAVAADLTRRLGVPAVMLQECHALCLAEKVFGAARTIDDFAVVDVSAGVGAAVYLGGKLLLGHSGLAGELGHIPVVPDGELCGCGNRGCLETVACDSALARLVGQRVGRKLSADDLAALVEAGENLRPDLEAVCDRLARGLATLINLVNPATVFIHGRLFELDSTILHYLIERTRAYTLPPSFGECIIRMASVGKRQGAVAAIVEQLTSRTPVGERNRDRDERAHEIAT